jgi:hypothetical protein
MGHTSPYLIMKPLVLLFYCSGGLQLFEICVTLCHQSFGQLRNYGGCSTYPKCHYLVKRTRHCFLQARVAYTATPSLNSEHITVYPSWGHTLITMYMIR